MDVRRVVTGHDADGKAVFASDERVPPIVPALLPAHEFHHLWGADEAPRFPDDGSMPARTTYFPPLGGFRFGLFTLPPEGSEVLPDDVDVAAGLADLEAKLPGLHSYNERDEPGMHTTPTVDFEVVLSGSVVLELDDGAAVTLEVGDTVVQNGTRHRWRNPGSVPAVLAVFLVGAHHDRIGGPGAG
jgi:mannose-6-phosphate isomerase-like protein (cupin superfamily)